MSNGFWNYDLMDLKWGRSILKSRMFQPALIILNLFIFFVLIMAGLVGTPIGNQNAAIIMIWIFWFFLLIAVMIPFGGRLWCIMCPLPAPGEWLSRVGIARKVRERCITWGKKWPKRLDNIWLQNFGFLTVATLSPIILTRPEATSYLLLLMIALGLIFSLVFVKQNRAGRVFCKYLCPVGGFIGLYSLMGALEVKVKDGAVCKAHKEKPCLTGNADGWGCPWYEYPGNMDRNLYCGLCAECIKTCTKDNIAFRTRPFGLDLLKKRKVDEAFKSFIMLASALMFITVFFGWWGSWKDIANPIDGLFVAGPVQWKNLALYALSLWGASLLVFPLVHLLFSWLSKKASGVKAVSTRTLFLDYAYALVPLGLMAWIAFVLGMIMVNGAYVVSVISDPFGWGWNLFGTADYSWRAYFPDLVPHLQMILLLIGLAGTTYAGYRVSIANFGEKFRALRAMFPISVLFIAVTGLYMYLFVML